MCGRFALYSDSDRIERFFAVETTSTRHEQAPPSWNIAPTERVGAVLAAEGGRRQLAMFRWGLIPSWVKDLSTFRASTFNARAEGIATRPMFQSSFKRKRLLIPADVFYEWRKSGNRQPYLFKRADNNLLAFAGLWDLWKHPDGGWLRSCTILTTDAGPDVADVHYRMPVVLEPDSFERWLDPDLDDREELEALLLPAPAGTLVHYPIDFRINSARNNDPRLLEPIAEVPSL